MNPFRPLLSFLLFLAMDPCHATDPVRQASSPTTGSISPESCSQRDARMAWWREARFGMFVHWGLYSGLAGTWNGKAVATKGGMEWLQKLVKADTDTYATEALPKFQPVRGFALEWMKLAKEAGCKYIVFTTKHHEGFALHDSKYGDFNAGCKLHRDLVREIVEAARTEGLKVGFYHSLIDWHDANYDYNKAKGLPYPQSGRPLSAPRDHSKYIDHLHAQVGELLTKYGPVDVVWWDFSSKEFEGDEAWRATELMRKVREMQPGIIMNNRLYSASTVKQGENEHKEFNAAHGDFITPEQRIPATGMPGVDWESCMTLNTTWGYSEHDHAWKSEETLIRNLVDIASKGGNYLLNIGPKGDGSIPPDTVSIMKGIGSWMKVNSEAIYGTTASPFTSLPWGRCTRKGNAFYLSVFDWPKDGKLPVPLRNRILSCKLLADSSKELRVSTAPHGLEIALPDKSPDPAVSVIRLVIEGDPDICEQKPSPQPSSNPRGTQ